MKDVLVICGPTASGKSALAVTCAKKLNTSIISADSQLVYRCLDIGTAKPTEKEMQGVKHYLIDEINPDEDFSVSDYRNLARPIIDELISKDKIPVICGGTGFYINSLLFDFSYSNIEKNDEIRNKYSTIKIEYGTEHLYSMLMEKDPKSAMALHPNDTKRIIRALEIYELSGKRKSELNDGNIQLYNYLAVAVDFPRDILYERINKRVDDMFSLGLVDEVKNLISKGYENCQCMKAIGYKEIIDGLNNGLNECTMRDKVAQNTRNYAKRQITYFKKLKDIVWLKPENANAEYIVDLMKEL